MQRLVRDILVGSRIDVVKILEIFKKETQYPGLLVNTDKKNGWCH